ncbi:MAG: KH domain-containing protein [Clostridia bacterium]|nr:KH domain-containing protein [Clostridia bacterium]MDD4275794.1 KH domain-containing protein [Clostridia bacterium]
MEKVVEYIVKQLAEFPDKVQVSTVEENGANIIKVLVAEEDMGKIIGKHGRVAGSIRTIIKSLAIKSGKRYNVQIDSLEKITVLNAELDDNLVDEVDNGEDAE